MYRVKSWQKMVISVAGGVFFLDQFSKILAAAIDIPIYVNEGVSFGWRPAGEWLTMGLALFVGFLAVTTYRYWRRAPLITGLFLGGVLANLLDRVLYGGIRDWLLIPFVGLYNNLADWAIAMAVLLLVHGVMPTSSRKNSFGNSH